MSKIIVEFLHIKVNRRSKIMYSMYMEKSRKLLIFLGLLCLTAWFIDLANIIFFLKKPSWVLWYSSLGLGVTGIALLLRKSFLIWVLFCSYFVLEMVWVIGFFSLLLFHQSFFEVAAYAFEPTYPKKDFYITLYHVLIPFSLFFGVISIRGMHPRAWIGSTIFLSVLITLTYFFVSKNEPVNCVHMMLYCKGFVFLQNIPNPLRIIIGIVLTTGVIYIPTNILLVRVGKRLKWG